MAPPALNGYDTACPANLPKAWIDSGAVADQCVTVQAKEPCSSFATANEKALSPCLWDANLSMVAALGEGDFLVVPKTVEHRPRSLTSEPVVLMVEPNTTLNTGNAESALTVRDLGRLR